jgi:putative inorganic carbon (HCO3(-)) transporter
VLLALTLAVALNFHVVGLVFPYDDDRLLQLIALAAVASLAVARPSLREGLAARLSPPSALRPLVIGCAVLALLSVAQARQPLAAFTELGLFLLFATAALSIAVRSSDREDDRDLALAGLIAFVGIGAYEIQFLAAYSASLLGAAPLLPRELFAGFATPRFLGQVQTWSLPLAILPLLLLPRLGTPWRVVLFLIPSLWWTMALAAGGRGTLAASILATIVVTALYRARARRWLIATLASMTAGLFIYLLLFMVLPTTGAETGLWQGFARVSASSGRIALWGQALELIKSAPLLGVGPMHYACLELHAAGAAHPHNALLQLASEWGIILTLIVVSALTLWFWRWQRNAAARADQGSSFAVVPVALSAAFLAAAAHSMLSGIIVMPLSQTLGVLTLGSMLRFQHPRSIAGRPAGAPTRTWPVAGLVLAGLLGAGVGLPPLIENYSTRVGADGFPGWLAEPPRFWKAGTICHGDPP